MATDVQQRITLYLDVRGQWIADMSQTVNAATIRSLFGSDHVPTPYTVKMQKTEVLNRIQMLNPECIIALA